MSFAALTLRRERHGHQELRGANKGAQPLLAVRFTPCPTLDSKGRLSPESCPCARPSSRAHHHSCRAIRCHPERSEGPLMRHPRPTRPRRAPTVIPNPAASFADGGEGSAVRFCGSQPFGSKSGPSPVSLRRPRTHRPPMRFVFRPSEVPPGTTHCSPPRNTLLVSGGNIISAYAKPRQGRHNAESLRFQGWDASQLAGRDQLNAD